MMLSTQSDFDQAGFTGNDGVLTGNFGFIVSLTGSIESKLFVLSLKNELKLVISLSATYFL